MSRTNSICPCYFFSGGISHFCLLPINKSTVFYLLAINKSNISSIIKALIALYDALGGDKGMDVLRVVGYLLCQCRLARCQGWLQERIAITRQDYLGGRRWNCIWCRSGAWAGNRILNRTGIWNRDNLHSLPIDRKSIDNRIGLVLPGKHRLDQ